MTVGLIGKKRGMTQLFSPTGEIVPVTLIEAGPCTVVRVKTKETDGYCALQLGFGTLRSDKVSMPMEGHFRRAKVDPQRWLRELRLEEEEELQELKSGDVLDVGMFKEGEKVDVTGSDKGRGFAGTVKRHGVTRGPMAHGSRYHRRPGSMGASSDPSRVYKGKVNPGRMGGRRVTVQNLEVVKVDKERNLLLVKGAVPGHPNSILIVRKSRKEYLRAKTKNKGQKAVAR